MCPQKEMEAARIPEEVASKVGGKPGNWDIMEVKRSVWLKERGVNCVESAERSSKAKTGLSFGFRKAEAMGNLHKQFQGSKERNFFILSKDRKRRSQDFGFQMI